MLAKILNILGLMCALTASIGYIKSGIANHNYFMTAVGVVGAVAMAYQFNKVAN